jgi:predicted ArsR family transcriptional regulator
MAAETQFASSDSVVLDLLRQRDAMTVLQLARELQVTATAVRQRLTRLMAQGLIERRVVKSPRGRPGHNYTLTEAGRRKTGDNFHDLATALWDELRAVADPEVRRGLLQRVAHRMASGYAKQVDGETLDERMESLAEVYRQRDIPFQVERKTVSDMTLPVLKAVACPYPDLAEKDRSVCAMERLMFAELLESNVRLSQCRLDGGACCTFE